MDITVLQNHPHLSCDYCQEDNPERSNVFMHLHPQMELYYLIRGDVEYLVENRVYHPKPGDMILLRPGELHSSKVCSSHSGPYERYNLRFSPELLTESLNSRLLLPFLNRPGGVLNHYSAQELPSDFIRACLQRMFAANNGGEARILSYLIPVLQEIYDVWISREVPLEFPQESLPAKIISYINRNLATIQSPQDLSEVFYLSQSQLYREFREYTGTSIWNYVRTKRLTTARERMQNGEHPAEAAATCGFADYSTFYRAYKRQFGRSPQEDWSRQNRR